MNPNPVPIPPPAVVPKSDNPTTITVVGAGIVGLYAALTLARAGHTVTLLEQDTGVGGGFRSDQQGGYWFDRGTHLPAVTGVAAIDDTLFGPAPEREQHFHAFKQLALSSFINGQGYGSSPLINLHSLAERYQPAIDGLLAAPGASATEVNALAFTEQNFGAALTASVVRPALERLYGVHAHTLHKVVLDALHLRRFIALTPEQTVALKTQPQFDDRLGYHRSEDAAAPAAPRYFYPRGTRGVGPFAEGLAAQITAAGGTVQLDSPVTAVEHSHGKLTALRLANGQQHQADQWVWALPAALLARLTGIAPTTTIRPARRRQWLYHLVLARAEPTFPHHYATCHDPAFHTFRVMAYDNLQPPQHPQQPQQGWRITVEVWADLDAQPPASSVIAAELVSMRHLSADNALLFVSEPIRGLEVPVVTPQLLEQNAVLRQLLQGQLSNLHLAGQGSASAFFMTDLLRDAERTLLPLVSAGDTP